jgi:hypothetical protein
MKVYRKGIEPTTKPESFSFPNVVAELSDETIRRLKLRSAITRFGLALLETYDKTVVGVEISGMDLHFIYRK